MASKLKWTIDEREEIVRWVASAIIDRSAAGHLVSVNHLNVAVYHLQQASEKLIKTFLLANRAKVDKTHDIQRLLLSAIPIDPSLIQINTIGAGSAKMSDFATEYRYPNFNGNDLCDISEAKDGFEYTDALYTHLAPFFGDAIITDALAHARESMNPFLDNSIEILTDSILKSQAKHTSPKP